MIAKQQKRLALGAVWQHNGIALGTFSGVGASPPKPPPLVELQRNPSGLRFFLCVSLQEGLSAAKNGFVAAGGKANLHRIPLKTSRLSRVAVRHRGPVQRRYSVRK